MLQPDGRRTPLILNAALAILLTAVAAAGQTPVEPRPLPPGQALEREVAGGESHAYKLDFEADEFFQVRVEQKGVDVTLELSDAAGKVLASMDSPNGKEGPETLSFVAEAAGAYVLKVSGLDAKAEKGGYSIRREAPRAATARDRRRVEVERLFVAGMAARAAEGQAEAAATHLSEARAGWEELGDAYMVEMTTRQANQIPIPPEILAIIQGLFKELETAQAALQQGQQLSVKSKSDSLAARAKLHEALMGFRAVGAKAGDKALSEKVSRSGATSGPALNYLKALRYFAMGGEANSLSAIGQTHYNVGEWQEQVNHTQLSATAFRDAARFLADENIEGIDRKKTLFMLKSAEASAIGSLASTLSSSLGRPDEALKHLGQVLEMVRALYQEEPDPQLRFREALLLKQLGLVHVSNSKDRKSAVEFLSKAVEVYRTLPDQKIEVANLLAAIGAQHSLDYNYEAALKDWDAALEIYRELDDKFGQVAILQAKGSMYALLDDRARVREYFGQSLTVLRAPDFAANYKKNHLKTTSGFNVFGELSDQLGEQFRQDQMAFAYERMEDYGNAIEHYENALAAARAGKDHLHARMALASIGYAYAKLERWEKANEYYRRALEISRGATVKETTASDLANIGWTLFEAGKPREAVTYQNEALALFQAAGFGPTKALTARYTALLNDLARTHHALGNRRLAIFYGKQGVNVIQSERQRLSNFDAEAQKGFLGTKEKHYRRLADWLIEEGRLPEAEQVLRMLKEDEYLRFVRRNHRETGELAQRADMNADEAAALKRYDEISGGLAALGAEYAKLEEKKNNLPEGAPLPPAEQKRFNELARQLEEANGLFQVFLLQLAKEFAKTPKGTRVREENSGLGADLKRWRSESGDGGVVVLYTVLGEDRYRVILTTPDAQTGGKTEIRAVEVRRKIEAFRQAVQNPTLDPRPLGKELYDIIVKPVEKQLADAKARTLLWSLDDTLRYLPLAALWDGERYFGEKYQNVIITLASRTRLGDRASQDWRVLGLGVSEPKQVEFPEPGGGSRSISFSELPGAHAELRAIVRDETSPEAEVGVLPGRRLLDSTFTEAALTESLGRRYKVVHIASHFSFRPGDPSRSFLLLGDGNVLTLNKLMTSPQLAFTGVELLTLSAGNTAVGRADADGVEIESFGVIAQSTGAKAVLATLWSVADQSTSVLMSEFYRMRTENPRLTKAEALQSAQKALIKGEVPPRSAEGHGSKPAGAGPYSHPYFWSPFVLIGNWK